MQCEFCGNYKSKRGLYSAFYLCDECRYAPKPIVVCLCGSTKFMDDYRDVMLRETLLGKVVLTVGNHLGERRQDIHDDNKIKRMLDRLHMAKIRMADEVIIINRDDYIGESTGRELAMARKLKKVIRFEFPHDET